MQTEQEKAAIQKWAAQQQKRLVQQLNVLTTNKKTILARIKEVKQEIQMFEKYKEEDNNNKK